MSFSYSMRRLWWRPAYLMMLAAVWVANTRATTVRPPDFATLVAQAETVARVRVESVRSGWVQTPDGRAINTLVTMRVLRVLKGTAAATLTLDFLGGTVDDVTMEVVGMPKFTVGSTEIVFVRGNGIEICPLVALGHGRYRVQQDPVSGREWVQRDNRVPLSALDEVAAPLAGTAVLRAVRPVSSGMTLAAFEQAIVQEISTRAHRP